MNFSHRLRTFSPEKLPPAAWLAIAALILATDYLTGATVLLDVLVFFPVAFASWFHGRLWGLALAIAAPLARLGFYFSWTSPATLTEAIVNTLVRIVTFAGFAILLDLAARQREKIQVLEGILPTCAWCKQIRDPDGNWHGIETYISDRTAARFSHGICPECGRKHFPEKT